MSTTASVLRFEGLELDLRRGALRESNGDDIPLRPKSLALLRLFIENAERLLDRDMINRAIWPDVTVTDESITQCVRDVRRALGDNRQHLLKTVPRRGYIFDTKVISERPPTPAEATGLAPLAAPTANGPSEGSRSLTPPAGPSIAVLPFSNMSSDPEQEYFADGMVEEITMAIARLPWLFVIARNSAFTYKGKAIDVKQVAQELGVRYVLEGSVRKAGNRVRITGQLIDTATGAHIWAERFDGALDDIFELQDQVASGVAGAMEPKLRQSEIEHASRKPTANLTAYDLYLRAMAQSYHYTDEGLTEAVALARQALAIDPSYAPAAALIGSCRALQRVQGWGALSEEDIGEACRLTRQALEAERDDAETIRRAAWALFVLAGEVAMAAAALDRALALNPNAARAWSARGIIHAMRNEPEAAIKAIERARRLSPFDRHAFGYAVNIAVAHLVARRFEQAIEWADRALHDQPRVATAIRVKIVAFAHLSRLDEARAELSRVLTIDPELTIAGYREYFHFAAPEVVELYVTGLRLAGLPEG